MNTGTFDLIRINTSRLGRIPPETDTRPFEKVRLSRPEILMIGSSKKAGTKVSNTQQEQIVERIQQLVGAWLLTQDNDYYDDAFKLFQANKLFSENLEISVPAVNQLKQEVEEWKCEGVDTNWVADAVKYTMTHRNEHTQILVREDLQSVPTKYRTWKKCQIQYQEESLSLKLPLPVRRASSQSSSSSSRKNSASESLVDLGVPNSSRSPSPRPLAGSLKIDKFRMEAAKAVSRSFRNRKLSQFQQCAYVLWCIRSGVVSVPASLFLDILLKKDALSRAELLQLFVKEGEFAEPYVAEILEKLVKDSCCASFKPEYLKSDEQFTLWRQRCAEDVDKVFDWLLKNEVIQKAGILCKLKALGALNENEYLRQVGEALSDEGSKVDVSALSAHPITKAFLESLVNYPTRPGYLMRSFPPDKNLVAQMREHYMELAQQGLIFLPSQRGKIVSSPTGEAVYNEEASYQPLASSNILKVKPAIEAIELLLQYSDHGVELSDNSPIAYSPRSGYVSFEESSPRSPKSPHQLWGDTKDLERDHRNLLFESVQIENALGLMNSSTLSFGHEIEEKLKSRRRIDRLQGLCQVLLIASPEQLQSLAPPQYSVETDEVAVSSLSSTD